MPNRRRFIGGMAAAGALAVLPAFARGAASRQVWVSSRQDAQGRPYASAFDADGRVVLDLPLPARGHGAAWSASRNEVVIVSRRPGDYLLVVDTRTGEVRHRLAAVEGRFFNGHAVYAGRYLYATETSVDDTADEGNGRIGVYEPAAAYRRVGEYLTHGHDPHELLALGEDVLVVANGGLLTHPDAPGIKLNLDTMDSSLAYIDAHTGRVLAIRRLPRALHQLSLRHVAVAHDGTIAVAMQYEGPSSDLVPLVALHRPGAPAFDVLEFPAPILSGLRNYCGSVAFDRSRRVLGVSSPRGGVSVFWSLDERRALGEARVADGCGIAPGGRAGEFVISSGLGGVQQCGPSTNLRLHGDRLLAESGWDNHLVAFAGMLPDV